jgi:hypothetical protein
MSMKDRRGYRQSDDFRKDTKKGSMDQLYHVCMLFASFPCAEVIIAPTMQLSPLHANENWGRHVVTAEQACHCRGS